MSDGQRMLDDRDRLLRCIICDSPLRHPKVGRPRKMCRKRRCWLRYFALRKERMRQETFVASCPECKAPDFAPHRRTCLMPITLTEGAT